MTMSTIGNFNKSGQNPNTRKILNNWSIAKKDKLPKISSESIEDLAKIEMDSYQRILMFLYNENH